MKRIILTTSSEVWHVNVILSLSGPLDTEFREGLDIPDTANTFVQGEIKTLSMDDWMKTSISDHSKIKMIKSITREC